LSPFIWTIQCSNKFFWIITQNKWPWNGSKGFTLRPKCWPICKTGAHLQNRGPFVDPNTLPNVFQPKWVGPKCKVPLSPTLHWEHLHWFSPSAKGTATPSAFIILMTHRSTSNQESLQGLPKYKPWHFILQCPPILWACLK
jgi:hypothetical protein